MGKTKRAIGYVCDIPIPNTDMVISKEDQRIRILKCVEQENLELITICEDEKYTEEFMNRPGVQKILNFRENFDVLLIERVWCMSRKMKELKPFLKKIDAKNVKMVCSSCLWDMTRQQGRHRYMEPLGEKMRKEAKAQAAAKNTKKAA